MKNKYEFSIDRLEMIRSIEAYHFWFLGRRQLIIWLLGKSQHSPVDIIAELGCGTGYHLKYWLDFGRQVFGIDRLMSATVSNLHRNEKIYTLQGNICALPLASNSVDTVISLDVLEHVPDEEAVDEIKRVIKPNGNVILTVPAMPWLWSIRDETAGHRRRYTPTTLRNLFEKKGFSINYINYYQCFLFPLVLIVRLLGRKKANLELEEKPNKWVNAFLSFITKIEFRLIKIGISLPWGSSLVLVARKNYA